jgi:hypothetical protein
LGKREKPQQAKPGKQGRWGVTVMFFFIKNSLEKKEVDTVHFHDATANSFVARVQGKVFAHLHAVTVKYYSSV